MPAAGRINLGDCLCVRAKRSSAPLKRLEQGRKPLSALHACVAARTGAAEKYTDAQFRREKLKSLRNISRGHRMPFLADIYASLTTFCSPYLRHMGYLKEA